MCWGLAPTRNLIQQTRKQCRQSPCVWHTQGKYLREITNSLAVKPASGTDAAEEERSGGGVGFLKGDGKGTKVNSKRISQGAGRTT